MKLYVVVLFYLVQSTPIEEYALKVSGCIAECRSLSDAEQRDSCLGQCDLWTACSGSIVCALRCGLNNTGCNKACASFATAPNCSIPCNNNILNFTLNPESLSMTVNVRSIAQHLVLLDRVESNDFYTVNFTIDDNVTFVGLYPGKSYRVRLIVFTDSGCCTETGNVSKAQFISSSINEFPLAPELIEMFRDNRTYLSWNSTIDEEPILFPEVVYYESSSSSYESYGNLKGNLGGSFLRYRRSDLSIIPMNEMKTAKPYRLGAGYIVQVYADTSKTVAFMDETYQERKMVPLSTEFCAFVPNEKANVTISLQPSCVNSTNITTVTFHTNTLVNIQTCFRSKESNGTIDKAPCCEGGGTRCLYYEGQKTVAQFNQSNDYLVYLNTNFSTCKKGYPCSGVFERLNTSQMELCDVEPKSIVLQLVLGALCTTTIFTATLAVWLWCKRKNKEDPNKQTSKIHEMFDLDRAKIIKHKLIGRGNFGLVFEGKLIISRDFDLEGETSMADYVDVAIKILKVSKTDEEGQREAREAMRAEINLMKKIQEDGRSDQNVLKMIGCVVNASPYMMILELCSVNLKVYLRSHRVEIEDQQIDAERLQTLSIQDTPELSHQVVRRTATDPCVTGPRSALLFNRHSDRGETAHYMDSKKGMMTMSSPSTGTYKDDILSRKKMLDFCMQVAKGMEFLHSIDILHRDIATSNILVQIDDDVVVLKICDFGQSKMLYRGEYTIANNVAAQRKMFRLRWTSPEVIANSAMWSKASDVWSYGVLMWEIFTLGGTPYPGWPDYTMQSSLMEGHRMSCPPVCSADIFEIMTNCWSQCPADRWSFLDIKEKAEDMVMDEHNAEFGIEAGGYVAFPIDPEVDPERDLETVPAEDKDIDIREIDVGSGALLDEEFVVSVAFNNQSADEAEVVINMNM